MSDIKVGDMIEVTKAIERYFKVGDKAKVVGFYPGSATEVQADFNLPGQKVTGDGIWYVGQKRLSEYKKVEEKKKAGTPAKRGIRIKTEKYENYGRRFIRILEIDALEKKDLPEEYLAGDSVWKDGEYLRFNRVGENEFKVPKAYIYVGVGYYSENFSLYMQFIKQCGIRLEEINKKKREKAKPVPPVAPKAREWSGTREYVI